MSVRASGGGADFEVFGSPRVFRSWFCAAVARHTHSKTMAATVNSILARTAPFSARPCQCASKTRAKQLIAVQSGLNCYHSRGLLDFRRFQPLTLMCGRLKPRPRYWNSGSLHLKSPVSRSLRSSRQGCCGGEDGFESNTLNCAETTPKVQSVYALTT
jgi:hypothetical protein